MLPWSPTIVSPRGAMAKSPRADGAQPWLAAAEQEKVSRPSRSEPLEAASENVDRRWGDCPHADLN